MTPTGITPDRERELRGAASVWAAHAVGRGRVPLLPPCAPDEEQFQRALCREAIPREIERERRRRARGDLPIAQHPHPHAHATAPVSPRHAELRRMASAYADRVAAEGGDIQLPQVEPGEVDQFRDLCIAACRRGMDRHRGRRRAARAAAPTEEPR